MAIEDLLIYGLYNGSLYALLALGFSLVYGVGGIMNLSHGVLYIFSGFLIVSFLPLFAAGFTGQILAMILSIVVMAFIGAVIYWVVVKPMQDKPVTIFIITFAVGMFLEQLVKILVTTDSLTLPPLIPGSDRYLGVLTSNQNMLVIVIALVTVVAFTLFLKKTKVGNSIRAISQDRDAARLMGINVNMYLMYTMMISAFLAALAGGITLQIFTPDAGSVWLTTAFGVVILGGLGSLEGSVIAAYIQAFVTQYVILYVDPALAGIVPLVVIVMVLIIRPQGLLGKKERS